MKDWQKDLLFLILLVFGMSFVVFLSWKATAGPIDILDNFHGTEKPKDIVLKVPEQAPSTLEDFHKTEPVKTEQERPKPPAPELKPPQENEKQPLNILDGFHNTGKPLVENPELPEEIPEVKKKPNIEPPKPLPPEQRQVIASVPFVLSHNPTSTQKVWLSTDKKDVWLSFDFQLTQREFEKFPKVKSYLEGLELLAPKFLVGFTTQLTSGTVKPYIYTGALVGLKKGPLKGFKLKALVFNNSYREIFKTTKGRVAAYYFYDKKKFLFDNDFASFYGGWVSPPINVNLSNLDGFKANFKDLKAQSENIVVGIFYLPSVLKPKFSFNLETNLSIYSFSANYLF